MINDKVYKDNSSNNYNISPGDSKESPDESSYETLVFIDEAFLSKLIKSVHKYKLIDKTDLTTALLNKSEGIEQ
ncbi:MAG: hypothetical protein Q7R87_01635 [Nanoarchaeota archaeon]|nr:hypothetical protein [Nanoarchaeota archaeon]